MRWSFKRSLGHLKFTANNESYEPIDRNIKKSPKPIQKEARLIYGITQRGHWHIIHNFQETSSVCRQIHKSYQYKKMTLIKCNDSFIDHSEIKSYLATSKWMQYRSMKWLKERCVITLPMTKRLLIQNSGIHWKHMTVNRPTLMSKQLSHVILHTGFLGHIRTCVKIGKGAIL